MQGGLDEGRAGQALYNRQLRNAEVVQQGAAGALQGHKVHQSLKTRELLSTSYAFDGMEIPLTSMNV